MESNLKERLDLLWRIIGGILLLILVGIVKCKMDPLIGINIISLNLSMVIYILIQINLRKLTLKTQPHDVLIMYVIYKLVISFFMINTEIKAVIEILTTIVELIWLYNFYCSKVIEKSNE